MWSQALDDDRLRKPQHSPVYLQREQALDERRQHDRVPVNREFECIEDYIAEYVSSISPGGVFIRSKKPLPLGTRVNLTFSVIVDDVETVQGEGEVVRVEHEPGHTGMGVAFTRLSAQSKALIDEIMARHGAKSGDAQ